MRTRFMLAILGPVLALVISACLQPASKPFALFGQTLQDVTYCSPDGAPQLLDIYLPDEGGPWPVLIYIHGGAWMRGDKSEAAGLGEQMTTRGYAVVSVNYRLYPAARFPGIIEDVKCAVRFLRAHAGEYNLDAKRFAALGASSGGHYLAALLGTAGEEAGWDEGEYPKQSSRVQAVITMSGLFDLTRKFNNSDLGTLALVAFDAENRVKCSPVTQATPDDPPFLIIHGDRDAVVPLEQSQLLYDSLTQAGVPAQLVIVKNGDHGLVAADGSATPTQAELNQMMLDFLEKYLE